MLTNQPTPDQIMQIGLGFWPSKILLTAVKFQLFTLLARNGSLSVDFKEMELLPLTGPTSAAIAYK